jgi:hypothetical protein
MNCKFRKNAKRSILQEQMRKKRLEEKQKRIEQQQQKILPSPPKANKPEKIKKPLPPPKSNLLKLHGMWRGHMKTNRSCPLYGKEVPLKMMGINLLMTRWML